MRLGDAMGVAGLVVSVIGIPAAYWFARRQRQQPDFRYAVDFEVLIGAEDNLLSQGPTVHFASQSIDQLARSYVALWNGKGDTIRGSDVVSSDPLRLEFADDDSVLQVRTVAQSRPQIEVGAASVAESRSSVLLTFDFLDAGDGVVLEILHQRDVKPKVLGTVRGAPLRPARPAPLSLSPKSLKALALASKSGVLKFWKGPLPSPLYFLNALVMVTLAVLAVVGLFVYVRAGHEIDSPSGIVDTSGYDLGTHEGQVVFARHVRDLNERPLLLISVIIPSLFFLVFVGIWIFQLKARIPATVVGSFFTDKEILLSNEEP